MTRDANPEVATIAGTYMFSWERLQELMRFGVTGVFCLALNTAGVVLLTEKVGLHYLASFVTSSMVVTTVGFLINKYWTFRVSSTSVPPEFARYVITNCFAMLVSIWLCSRLVENLHLSYSLSVAIAGVTCAPLTYVTHRVWTFGLVLLYRKSISR